ncbi:MAG TPA: TIGR03435 family protein [Bryobacteraceae bacterium]|nr:TIGR03435 family protein [Bryobacteraceae bacterium]
MARYLALPVLAACLASATAQWLAPQFEVASIKVNKSGHGVVGGCHGIDTLHYGSQAPSPGPVPLGWCVITSARLGHLINIAFGLRSPDLIHGGPDWVTHGADRFDIEAKVEDPMNTSQAQLLARLRNLLIDRFALKFHRQTVEQQGFALVVGKNGPRLKKSAAAETKLSFGPAFKPGANRPSRPSTIVARKVTMNALVNLLSSVEQTPMVDKTGLDGDYDIELNWDDDQGPALSTAVQQQLGLKLEPQKVPVVLFVIDSAQKPSAN